MIDFKDELMIESGIRLDAMPQFFEIADGEVRRRRAEDGEPFADLELFQSVEPLRGLVPPRDLDS